MSIPPWPAAPLTETSQTISADPATPDADSVGLCEAWRGWDAATSSEFLNWFLFAPHEKPSTSEPVVREDWICFRTDHSELDDRARAILGGRLKLLRANPSIRIVIGGLTGRRGTIAQGMRIGLRRVTSIRAFLLAGGIDPGRIGIAVRGAGWSVIEHPDGSRDSTHTGGECRIQVADRQWQLSRN